MNLTLHRKRVLRVWAIILSVLLVFLFTVTLVLTQNKFLYNTINSALGGERRYLKSGDPSEYEYYKGDYKTKSEVYTAANNLNERINEEGIVLLKNEGALPLPSGSKLTVFGKNASNIVLGGSGSNRGDVNGAVTDVNQSLEKAGFVVNPVIRQYYQSAPATARPEVSMGSTLTGYPVGEAELPYSQAVRDSYQSYHDAAIVVFSRVGGEGFDLPRTMFYNGSGYTSWNTDSRQPVPGARSIDDHYLQLDRNETDMLAEAAANFDKVIVVFNSASPLELGFLDDPSHYAYHENILGAVWIGDPGNSGLNALGRVLAGNVNPSGRTVDTYAREFENDPTFFNFGNYLTADGNRYTKDGKAINAYFVEYREGIWFGYRYYETMAAEREAAQEGAGEEWYRKNVVYPFGYGLSYTSFEWSVSFPETELSASAELTVEVSVKNTGQTAGKDVVELYYTPPYRAGGIEKTAAALGGFVKTDLLAAGEEKTYTLSLSARDMASYDYSDANGNGFRGYELEAGEYTLSVRRNAHDVVAEKSYTLGGDIRYETSVTGKEIVNLFDNVSGKIGEYLSRKDCFANFGVLKGAENDHELSAELIAALTYQINDKESDPWYSSVMPEQSARALTEQKTEVQLCDLIGKEYDDPLWEKLLSQLTVDQMKMLVSVGNYRTVQIENIGKMLTLDSDGPMGFASFMGDGAVYGTCYYASECVLAATFNRELAEAFGEMVGNESLVGDEDGDGRTYSGWYAPAMNLHRSQFGGRNFEYYSEDPLLSGEFAASVVKGAMKKGVYTYVKHFALNEQETNRDTTGLVTWANEQAMRELYFLPFQKCVEGGTTAVMSSFNRIGTEWTGGSYNLLTRLLREEWGFCGMVITDFNLKAYMNVDQMLRAGGDLNLSPDKGPSSTKTATEVTALRRATKNILYTVSGSNAMNGTGPNIKWGYALPWWVIWLIVADCAVFAIDAVLWTFYALLVRSENKKTLKEDPNET